jgi:hypothetical protein
LLDLPEYPCAHQTEGKQVLAPQEVDDRIQELVGDPADEEGRRGPFELNDGVQEECSAALAATLLVPAAELILCLEREVEGEQLGPSRAQAGGVGGAGKDTATMAEEFHLAEQLYPQALQAAGVV